MKIYDRTTEIESIKEIQQKKYRLCVKSYTDILLK